MPPRSTKSKKEKSALLSAFQFVAQAAKAEGEPFETHICLANHSASFSNRILSLSAPIAEDITACPRVHPFIKALERVGPNFSLTVVPGSVVIAGGGLRFTVPAMEALGQPVPDPSQAAVTDSLALGFRTILPASNGRLPIIEIRPDTMLATNGQILLEYYHGLNLPTVNLPAEFCALDFAPVGIALGEHSLTLWDEAGRWIRTALPVMKLPEKARGLFDHPHKAVQVPTGLWEGLKAIADFSEDGFIRFRENTLQTHEIKEKGASVTIPGLVQGPSYAVVNLQIVQKIATSIDLSGDRCFFYGENVRGLMIGDKRV